MEIRNNSNVVLKQGSNPNFEKSRKELARNLDIPK